MELVNRDEFNVEPLWDRLPAIVRGILVAELVVSIGTIPPSIAVILNFRTSPSIPWMLVVTAAWLSFFWWYVSGTRVATQHAGSPTARSACTIAVEARMDMSAHCRDTWDYRHDRDGFRDGASGASAAGGVRCTNRLLKVRCADSDLCDRLY